MNREYKNFSFEVDVKAIDGRKVPGVAAVFGNVDSYGDRLHKGAFKKTIKERGSQIKHLWQHDFYSPPIAAVRELREVGLDDLPDKAKQDGVTGGLLVVREYLETPRGEEVYKGILSGAITEMSFAYDPTKFDFEEDKSDDEAKYPRLIRNLREVRLWETSDVLWGANDLTAASKSALPYQDHGVAAEGESWEKPTLSGFTGDGWEDLTDSEKRRVAAHFGWQANNPPESFGDLKLPHHRPAESGTGPAVWNGVKAAMGRLLQAGTDIPEGERRSVYDHLAKHYEQFDKEPPDFKWALLAWAIADVSAAAGPALLSTDALRSLSEIGLYLNDALLEAEPPRVNAALTYSVMRRLAIAEHEISLR